MVPSELAKQVRMAAEGGSAAAQSALGGWHLRGEEGLEQDHVKAARGPRRKPGASSYTLTRLSLSLSHVKAAAWSRKAADRGHPAAQCYLASCYLRGKGLEQNDTLAAEWGRKAADQGLACAQLIVGDSRSARGMGVKKDLPLGKRYLELSAAQGYESAVALLKGLRKCACCGKLDVHHMICGWCRNLRYCDTICQLRHWQRPADPHKPHCGKRREAAGKWGSSSESADPSADNN